jgi:hypothetical protein
VQWVICVAMLSDLLGVAVGGAAVANLIGRRA